MDKEHRASPASSRPPQHLPTAAVQTADIKEPATASGSEWPLCSASNGLGDSKRTLRKPTPRQSPVPQQRLWIHSALHQHQDYTISPAKKPELNSFSNRVKEGQRVQRPFQNGAEFDNVYADTSLAAHPPTTRHPTMVQKKTTGPTDTMNGSSKRQTPVPYARGGMKAQNGTRSSFQTDVNISGGRLGDRRELQPWDGGGPSSTNGVGVGGLEDSTDGKKWDQFKVNEQKFGVRTDYHEDFYTTSIDRTRPDYNDKLARADKLARKIEGTAPVSAHTAEERVMDHVAGADDGQDEEDKYSGVKRSDFPPLGSTSNVYTPPARRAPTGQATVKGAPVDPAIISSQIRAPTADKVIGKSDEAPTVLPKAPSEAPQAAPKITDPSSKDAAKAADSASKSQADAKKLEERTVIRASLTSPRKSSPTKENQPLEKTIYSHFQVFAQKERETVRGKTDEAKKKKLKELIGFANTFKLGTPVPKDLIGIIAKDPKKQAEIQEKAKKNAEEVQRSKELVAKKTEATVKEAAPAAAKSVSTTKPAELTAAPASAGTATTNAADARAASRSAGVPSHTNAGAGPNRHPGGNRQSYGQYQPQFRGDRAPGQNLPRHNQQGGHMAQLRGEHQRLAQAPLRMNPDMRIPPTGPANSMGPPVFPSRHVMPPMGPPRLNPSTTEFIPSAQPFIPTGPSAASSPRSAMNIATPSNTTPVGFSQAPLRLRKAKSIDVNLCNILSGVKSMKPDVPNKQSAWDENGLRPPYETQITWKSVLTVEEGNVSWKEQFERRGPGVLATPTSHPAIPQQMPHQHQLPFHLQQGAQNTGSRQSPHIPHIAMHGGHPGHPSHMPFNNGDDGTRMMHSNSNQSYASPRPGQVPMAFPPNMINSPSAMQYSQPVMPGYMGTPGPQMAPQMRYPQNPQYMAQQHGHMGPPMMIPQGFMPGPQQMMQGAPQMPMGYGHTHPNFVPPGAVPPQAMQGPNGYPSPGRPAAPMMVHQGSQHGHMYGVSPGMPFQQPHFQQPPGQMGNMRVNSNPGPQQGHQYGPQQNRGNGYGGKNYTGPHQGPSPTPTGPGGAQARAEAPEEAK